MVGSSWVAKDMTLAGTRKPVVSSSIRASGLPRCRIAVTQSSTETSDVACARSPSTVTDPVAQRRPTARSIIGERSCASSSTTWAVLAVRSSASAASSTRTASASVQRAVPAERDGLGHSSKRCSSALRRPSAAVARISADDSSDQTTPAASVFGHTEST
jgi:hypothetical protein